MSDTPNRAGSSRALQGCLFGAVALFVVMLIGMLYLGYVQFQNNTDPAQNPNAPAPAVSTLSKTSLEQHV
jgi:hypothetical protein